MPYTLVGRRLMKPSKIAWTDFSGGPFNFVSGCTPVSAGCKNCYAKAIYDRFGIRDFSRVMVDEDKLERLRTMRFPEYSPKRGAPHRPMAFVVDTGDLFHEDVPDGFLVAALDVMTYRMGVTWQILTKRAKRMREFACRMYSVYGFEWPKNIWLGVTCENQAAADERLYHLDRTMAPVRFVSVEPMLEPVDLEIGLPQTLYTCQRCGDEFGAGEADHNGRHAYCGGEGDPQGQTDGIDWVICGAESGPHRRPFDVAWAEHLYDQCSGNGILFFGKQNSGLRPGEPLLLHGDTVHEWPSGPGISYIPSRRAK